MIPLYLANRPLFVRFGLAGKLFDLATTGGTLVQSAFRAQRWARLATLLPECDLATLAAEDNIAAMERRAAAKDGAFVQAANGANRCPLFAGVPIFLEIAAKTAERDLRLGMVLVRYPHIFFLTTGNRQRQCG
jgi:hypothetical protein